MPSNHASARSLARPLANSESLILCNSHVMSSSGGPPPESLDAFGLPIPDGGGSTSVPTGFRPFKVSLMASNERSMRASSGDGGGGTGGSCDDAPLPRLPRVLTNIQKISSGHLISRNSNLVAISGLCRPWNFFFFFFF
jgi:hypothetical protein